MINPNQVKNLRSRYGSAGNKDDRFDAYVLADTLRTDRARLRVLIPDSRATVTLRATCRARKDLVNTRVALANQLRAHLHTAFPAGALLFADVDSGINLDFLTRFTHQGLADWLSPKRLAHWLRAVGYCGRTSPDDLHNRLLAAPRGPADDHGLARSHITLAYVSTLRAVRGQITALDQQISEQLAAHPDSDTFTSLPRSGTVRAARLLSEIGDCRARFPTPDSLACLAGVAPSTRASGKSRSVGFRWACDKQLRDAVTDFAGDSRRANPWADQLYRDAIARGHDHPHAVRILARAWLFVIWHCWQNDAAYDPTSIEPCNASSPPRRSNPRRLDTGLLSPAWPAGRPTGWAPGPVRSARRPRRWPRRRPPATAARRPCCRPGACRPPIVRRGAPDARWPS